MTIILVNLASMDTLGGLLACQSGSQGSFEIKKPEPPVERFGESDLKTLFVTA